MKKILLSIMMFALLLPPIGGAQEAHTETIKTRPTLPIHDIRDLVDRAKERAQMISDGWSEDAIYEQQRLPRFVLVPEGVTPVENSWTMSFTSEINKDNFEQEKKRLAQTYGVAFTCSMDGPTYFIACFTGDQSRAENVSRDLKVRRVNQDRQMRNLLIEEKERVLRKPDEMLLPSDLPPMAIVRVNNDWALDMIDNRNKSLDGYYNFSNFGEYTTTYMLDSGISNGSIPQQHFGSRVTWSYDNNPGIDVPHHGTKASAVFGSQYIGTAPAAKMRVGKSYYSAFISNADWLTLLANVRSNIISERPKYFQVLINALYDGTVASTDMTIAVSNLISSDIPVIVPTGQKTGIGSFPTSYLDYWPQRVTNVFKVGMVNSNGSRNHYSSGDPCAVGATQHINGSNIFAPAGYKLSVTGTCLQAGIATIDANGANVINSGTSLAAPIVAGIMAMFGNQQVTYYPKEWMMRNAVLFAATPNEVSGLGAGDVNYLAYTNLPGNACRNSASYAEGVAPGSLVSCFGQFPQLQTLMQMRHDPNFAVPEINPLILSGTCLQGSGSCPGASQAQYPQTNIYIPQGLALDRPYLMRSYYGGSNIGGIGFSYVHSVAPGVFTINSSGTGYASALWYLTDLSSGAQTQITSDASGVSWNPATHSLAIAVYGTGWRNRSGGNPQGAPANCQIRFYKNGVLVAGGQPTVSFAYEVGGYYGLDQMNGVGIGSQMDNQGELEMRLYVDGKEANRTLVKIN